VSLEDLNEQILFAIAQSNKRMKSFVAGMLANLSAAREELLGAINYIATAIYQIEKEVTNDET